MKNIIETVIGGVLASVIAGIISASAGAAVRWLKQETIGVGADNHIGLLTLKALAVFMIVLCIAYTLALVFLLGAELAPVLLR